MGFIRHNKLQEGDNCIFQSSKSKKGVKLIYHPLVQSRRLQPQGYVPSAKSPRHGVAKPPYMLPWKTSLTDEQRSKVEEKVGAIQSEIPVYVTVMKNSNVNSRLCILGIGSEYATKYLPGGDENQLTTTMRLRCPGRSKDDAWEPEFQAKHGRHQIFGEGWRKFVTDKKLKPDDIYLFNLRKDTKMLTMDVHIIQ
ncbi:B3 domain-containing protein_Os12g40080-like [Miscanthus floridulus]|uniref:B3 domain-containing protein_Os12g40080-like n=1 Tax=Miscanthus floridulus TaxID=154761 RepID=UPI0034593EC3